MYRGRDWNKQQAMVAIAAKINKMANKPPTGPGSLTPARIDKDHMMLAAAGWEVAKAWRAEREAKSDESGNRGETDPDEEAPADIYVALLWADFYERASKDENQPRRGPKGKGGAGRPTALRRQDRKAAAEAAREASVRARPPASATTRPLLPAGAAGAGAGACTAGGAGTGAGAGAGAGAGETGGDDKPSGEGGGGGDFMSPGGGGGGGKGVRARLSSGPSMEEETPAGDSVPAASASKRTRRGAFQDL